MKRKNRNYETRGERTMHVCKRLGGQRVWGVGGRGKRSKCTGVNMKGPGEEDRDRCSR